MSAKKKTKSLGQFLIDLTPLLDVIFIFLIIVLTYQDTYQEQVEQQLSDSKATITEMETEVNQAIAEKATINDQKDTYDHLGEYVDVITVYATYNNPEKRKYRTIYIKVNMEEAKTFELNPSNSDEKWAECRSYLDEIIKNDVNSDKHIILSRKAINQERVLYRDDVAINRLFEELLDKYNYSGMYLKGDNGQ